MIKTGSIVRLKVIGLSEWVTRMELGELRRSMSTRVLIFIVNAKCFFFIFEQEVQLSMSMSYLLLSLKQRVNCVANST